MARALKPPEALKKHWRLWVMANHCEPMCPILSVKFGFPVCTHCAEMVDVTLENIKISAQSAPLLHTYEVFGINLAKGTSGAVRFCLEGIVDGKPLLKIEHVTRIDATAGPDWAQPPSDESVAYYIDIGGDLSYRLTLEFFKKGGSVMEASCWATGTRLVNAIPAICEANGGVLSVADIEIPTHRTRIR